jgi:ADP-heptose:LPS heptosyltransferase
MISALKNNFPESRIEFLTKAQYSDLLKLHSGIDRVISFSTESLLALRHNIIKNKYDIIFDLHKNIRSISITLFLNNVKRYSKDTIKKLILVAFKINLLKNSVPVFKKYLLLLKSNITEKDYLPVNSDVIVPDERIINDNYYVIAPSSKHFTKTLPKEKFAGIIEKIKNKKVVLVGDNNQVDLEICNFLSGYSKNIINYCGKTDFKALANILYYSDMVICNDSGVLHLAEALDKKVVVFYGNTVKEFGFFPRLDSTVIMENNDLKCRPCSHIGKSHCPKKLFKCMNDLQIDKIKLESI